MHRRAFLKASCALPTMAVMAMLPRFTRAETDTAGKWRVFEGTTRGEIWKPAGVTRVWLSLPLVEDTPYQKAMGNSWQAECATCSAMQDPKSGAAFILAEWPAPVKRSLDDWNMGPYTAIQGPNEFLYIGNLKDWNRLAELHRIKVPVMITTGQHDELTPACAMRIKQNISQSELYVFPNSSHMPFYEEPNLYYPALLNFLGQHRGGERK